MISPTTKRRIELNPERWQRLKSILAEALEQDSVSARVATLRSRCAEDTTLRRDAEALLDDAESMLREATDKFEACAENASAALRGDHNQQIGMRVGAYRIVRELGRGGMGAVFLAERADGNFEKQVAIKLLKRGTDTDEILRRFRTERQILAQLEHPNIARLLDAGTTDDGLPYFIMEYVMGVPVNRFVVEHSLSISERLQLFLKICTGVEAAHQRLVVHRDLKPTNILVAADGQPKLLDFGIAKLLGREDDALERTAAGEERLTPICASPEQVRGGKITVATDIYALGALLYEMMSGEIPHQFSTRNPSSEELARVIGQQDAAKPSERTGDEHVRRELRKGLDRVILTALRKDPEQRYRSVADFADCVRAHVMKEPLPRRRHPVLNGARRRIPLAVPAFIVVLAAAIVVVGLLRPQRVTTGATGGVAAPPSPDDLKPDKSIAVLPFQNRTEGTENSSFADGVQDAILTDLAKVADLKVISRSSVVQYGSGTPRNLAEIGQQLNVGHLLEGSVQRIGNRVRVSARLLDARTDVQLWAESYDREIADVFALQSEIAQAIVAQLRAKLLPTEKAQMEQPPTRDLAAYSLYLQAREVVNGYLDESDPDASLFQAVRLLEEAIRRDPEFNLAYCYLARAHNLISALGFDPSPARVKLAAQAVETALRLQPNSAEAHLAKADYHFRGFLDFDQAQKELEIARPGLPNNTPFYVLSGNVHRRQGHWDESERNFAKAVELDPRNSNAVNFLADTQVLMHKYSQAIETYVHARAAGLDPPILAVRIGTIDFSATGRTETLRSALAGAPPDLDVGGGETPLRILLALINNDYDAAARALAASPRTDFQDVDFSFYYPRSWYESIIARRRGDSEGTRRALVSARASFEAAMRTAPNPRIRVVLAQIYAQLGMHELAIQEGRVAVERMPISRDAYLGSLTLQGLAQVYAWAGEEDQAMDLLEKLAVTPGYVCYGYLIADPAWDPLRGNSRFERLVTSLAPHDVQL